MSTTAPSSPHHRLKKIGQALGVQPGEGEKFSLLLGQSFLLGIALISFYSSSNALFLSRFSAEVMPYVYLVAAGVLIVTGLGFYRLQTVLAFPVLLIGNFSLLLVGVVALRLLLAWSGADWVYFSLMVWLRLVWILGNLGLWTLVGRLFTLRQGKRLFSLITAGAVLSIILTGFVNSWLITWIGTANLIWIAAGSLAGALGLQIATLRRYQGEFHTDITTPETTALSINIFKNPYIWFIFLYTTLSTVGTYVLDYAFIGQVGSKLIGSDALGAFFGRYLGISTLVTLLFLVLVTNRILRRFGVRGGLLVDPLLVGAGALIVAFLAPFSGTTDIVFWLVVATKLLDEVTVTATTSPSVRIMYQPLPPAQRTRVQTFVESVISPLSMGISGALILLFRAVLQLTSLQAIYLLLVVFAGWLAMGVLLGREYYGALNKALRRRFLTGNEENPFADPTSLTLLTAYLKNKQGSDVMMAMALLAEHHPETLQQFLPDLLNHPDPRVRETALQRLDPQLDTTLPLLTQIVQDDTQPPEVLATALLRLSELGTDKVVPFSTPFLTHPDAKIRKGAIVTLLRHQNNPLLQTLLAEAIQGDEDERCFAAEVMGASGRAAYVKPLQQLMGDGSGRVRNAALLACGQLKHPELWPGVVAALQAADTRQTASRVLVEAGERALPAIAAALLKPVPPPMVRDLVRVCGKMQGPEVVQVFYPLVSHPNERIRSEVLYILARRGGEAGIPPDELVQAIHREAQQLAFWGEVFLQCEAGSLLGTTLGQVIRRGRVRMLDLAALLAPDPGMQTIRDNLFTDSEPVRANSVEMLDLLLSKQRAMRGLVLTVASLHQPAELARALTKEFPREAGGFAEALGKIVAQEEVNDWLAACALYTLARSDGVTIPAEVLARAESSLVRETASRLAQKSPQETGEPTMLTIEKTLILKTVSIFSETEDEILAELAQYLQECYVEAGQTVFTKGSPGDCLYVIVSGKVRVHDGPRTINELADRDVFGEMALLDPAPRSASVTAVEDTTLLRLDQAPFFEAVDTRSEIARGVIRVLSRHIRGMLENTGKVVEVEALQTTG